MQITPDPITVCDLDGHDPEGLAIKTYTFWLDGQRYELDVCADHVERVQQAIDHMAALATFGRRLDAKVVRGRGAGKARPLNPARSAGRSNAATRRQSALVREWAEANGFELPGRGRIPSQVKRAYDEAMAGG